VRWRFPSARRPLSAARALALLPLVLPALACSKPDDVRVSIHYDAPAGAPALGVVGAFVGGEKTQWPDLSPGESVSVVLNPLGEPAELTLLFELEGHQHTWEGPRPTLAGHSIAVTIHPDASVSERHCKLPCSLGG
jgi:hypothetical protein